MMVVEAPIQRLETRLDRLWQEWLIARANAQESQNIDDGIAAGRAWSAFLAEFVPDGGVAIQFAVRRAGHEQPSLVQEISRLLHCRHDSSDGGGEGRHSTLLDLLYLKHAPIEDDGRELARICGCSTRQF